MAVLLYFWSNFSNEMMKTLVLLSVVGAVLGQIPSSKYLNHS